MSGSEDRTRAVVEARQAMEGIGLTPSNFGDAWTMAQTLARSELVPDAMRGKPANVLLATMWGLEVGIGPARSLATIDVIKGKATMSADLVAALVMKHPDCEYFTLIESSSERCTYETKRRGSPKPIQLTWTIEDARRAGLTTKDNWTAYPAAMLRARTKKDLATAAYPDVVLGIEAAEEMAPGDEYSPPPSGEVVGEAPDEPQGQDVSQPAPREPEPAPEDGPEPETGQGSDEGAQAPQGPAQEPDEPDDLMRAIEAAKTHPQLAGLVGRILQTPKEMQAEYKSAYDAKMAEISQKGEKNGDDTP